MGGVEYDHITGAVIGAYERPGEQPERVADIVQWPDDNSQNSHLLIMKTWSTEFLFKVDLHHKDARIFNLEGKPIFDIWGRLNIGNCLE